MTVEDRIARLEKIAFALCKSEIDSHLDYSYQSWADPLHKFTQEIEDEVHKLDSGELVITPYVESNTENKEGEQ